MKFSFKKNITANIISLACNISIGIFLVPYFINNIGITTYALIPISMLFIEYIGLIGQSICTAINRQFTLAIKDNSKKNIIFNTALFGMILICILQVVFFIFPLLNVNNYVDIGSAEKNDVIILFICAFFSFVVSLLTSVFSVPLYSNNRLDIIQYGNVLRVLGRTFIIILLFNTYDASLELVGYATLAGTMISFFFIYHNFQKVGNGLSVSINDFNPKEFKSMASIGGWLIINQVGFLLLSRFDIYLANKLAGARVSSDYAIIIQVSNLIRSCIGVFAGLMGPSILLLYAQGKHELLKDLTLLFMRFISVISIIPVVIVASFNHLIFYYWLGEGFSYLDTLSYILIIPLFINTSVLPLFTINTAYNRVKVPGQMSILFGLAYLFFSIFMYKYSFLGEYSIAVSSVLAITLKNAFFTPIYTAKIMNEKSYYFLKVHVYSIIYFSSSFLFLYFLKGILLEELGDVLGFTSSVLTLVIMLVLVFVLSLSHKEKNMIKNVIWRKS